MKPVPLVSVPVEPLGSGFPKLLNFYQSFWYPPASDQDELTVGIVTAAKELRFKSAHRLLLKIFSEIEPFEIKSPPHTLWSITALKEIQPGSFTYLPVVEARVFPESKNIRSSSESRWRGQGFPLAKWVGPSRAGSKLQRWVLSLSPETTQKEAEGFCKKARAISGFCKVIARTLMPPIWQGTIRSAQHHFEKKFSGYLEITSPSGESIEVVDFVPEPRTQKLSAEHYAPPLLAIPSGQGNLALVQKVSLHDYLKAVVPSEIFPEAHIEAVKAQAVVARTYMLRHLPEDSKASPYAICASTLCQVYRGLEKHHAHTTRAIEETNSMVLWGEEGQPAETFYHGICGGHTEDKSVIWGPPARSYLQGSPDRQDAQRLNLSTDDAARRFIFETPHDQIFCASSTYTKADRWAWNKTLDEAAIAGILKELGLTPPLTSLTVLKRSTGGRALSLRLSTPTDSKIVSSELRIRMLFGGLLSSLAHFEAVHDAGKVIGLKISGLGYGHGVGMCQVGAIGRAEHGTLYPAILDAYYPGTSLATIMGGVR